MALKDVTQSPVESLGWFLAGMGLAGAGLWAHNRYFGGNESLEKWKASLLRSFSIDRLKVNKTLCFGTQTRRCSAHDKGQLLCSDLGCTFGPLGNLVEEIDRAKLTLDMATFSINSDIIGDAIVDAHERGVLVRVVTDADSSFSSSVMNRFREKGIEVRQRISPFHMHHKFIIIDEEILINGSMNFSNTGCFGNWENIVVTSEPGLVCPFLEEFSLLWEDFAQGKELVFTVPSYVRSNRTSQKQSAQ